MKLNFLIFAFVILALPSSAKLGDTRQQIEARYGKSFYYITNDDSPIIVGTYSYLGYQVEVAFLNGRSAREDAVSNDPKAKFSASECMTLAALFSGRTNWTNILDASNRSEWIAGDVTASRRQVQHVTYDEDREIFFVETKEMQKANKLADAKALAWEQSFHGTNSVEGRWVVIVGDFTNTVQFDQLGPLVVGKMVRDKRNGGETVDLQVRQDGKNITFYYAQIWEGKGIPSVSTNRDVVYEGTFNGSTMSGTVTMHVAEIANNRLAAMPFTTNTPWIATRK